MINYLEFFVISVLSCMAITMIGVIPPRPTTIRCNDTSIRRPFKGETITPVELLSGAIFGPLIIVSFNSS